MITVSDRTNPISNENELMEVIEGATIVVTASGSEFDFETTKDDFLYYALRYIDPLIEDCISLYITYKDTNQKVVTVTFLLD